MSLKAIIIDDEPLAVKVIANYIDHVQELDLVKTFRNAMDGLDFLKSQHVDIIFLDIGMPVLNGFGFLENLTKKPFVVITTAHDKYALKAYEFEAVDYLVKPIPLPRFLKAVRRVLELAPKRSPSVAHAKEREHLFVRVEKKKMQKIHLDEILVVESLKDYITIKTIDSEYTVHQSLTSFTEQLPDNDFIRIHRSFTVAVDKVNSITANSLLINNVEYGIGRNYLKEVRERILEGFI
ncbi:LytR/AlgR family response regulator transcription factor [Maribacter sp. 2307ULW6-5]|uniref:LytR/AlgR family response regulator transcription factor n=1 Tax=Maribacter sp. 2307ULW6-5 TaxID=3386275 RepID=UPI0039BD8C3B